MRPKTLSKTIMYKNVKYLSILESPVASKIRQKEIKERVTASKIKRIISLLEKWKWNMYKEIVG